MSNNAYFVCLILLYVFSMFYFLYLILNINMLVLNETIALWKTN